MSDKSSVIHSMYKWLLSTLSALTALGLVFVLEGM